MILGDSYHVKEGVQLDLSVHNDELNASLSSNFHLLESYINRKIELADAKFAHGGYLEQRNLYTSFHHFNDEEPRNIHLGIDLWAPAGTPILLPYDGQLICATNIAKQGDYGGLLIFKHRNVSKTFYTLYGHLSKASISSKRNIDFKQGDIIAYLGDYHENGGWPPHLHFQIMLDFDEAHYDYPGVCKQSEVSYYREVCPNPFSLAFHGEIDF